MFSFGSIYSFFQIVFFLIIHCSIRHAHVKLHKKKQFQFKELDVYRMCDSEQEMSEIYLI